MREETLPWESCLHALPAPSAIFSSAAGRGNISIAEALQEHFLPNTAHHWQIETFLPPRAVREDLLRYKFISDTAPWLLNLVYRVPFFYYRKLARERIFKTTDLTALRNALSGRGIQSLVAVSHRQAFWLSLLKKRSRLSLPLWVVMNEFGHNLGWDYLFWDTVNCLLTPLSPDEMGLRLPSHVRVIRIPPLCRRTFRELARAPGSNNHALLAAGYWGQITATSAADIIKRLLDAIPLLHIHVVCGTNTKLMRRLNARFSHHPRVTLYGTLPSLAGLMNTCASVITKPGFSTIVEAHAAGKKLFLVKGMPVAEDNNAHYAFRHFGAVKFSLENFAAWHSQFSAKILRG